MDFMTILFGLVAFEHASNASMAVAAVMVVVGMTMKGVKVIMQFMRDA
ncbi:hypothetical protein VLK31_35690 [Variovorax sp. H27-G14]